MFSKNIRHESTTLMITEFEVQYAFGWTRDRGGGGVALPLYSYLVGCCLISDLFGKGEPNIGSPLPNKSDIGQAADQTTVLLFPPRKLILLVIRGNNFKSLTSPSCTTDQSSFNLHVHSFGVRLAGGSNRVFSSDAIYQKLYSLCCSSQS